METGTASRKLELQDRLYEFPYHHVPALRADGTPLRSRMLTWGLEYLCYMHHAAELVSQLRPESVLEVGCGDGRFLGMLAPSSATRVGVDISQRAIQFARAFYPDIAWHMTDAESLTTDFDVVAAIEVLEHISDADVAPFLRTLESRCKRGGVIVLSVPTKTVPVTPKHHRHYDMALLGRQLADAGVNLELSRVDYIYRDDWLMRLFRRLTANRLWQVEVFLLNRLIWKHVWKRLRIATHATGRHMVVVLTRPTP